MPETPLKIPVRFAFLEVTSRCNFRCQTCPLVRMKRPMVDMPTDLALRLVDDLVDNFVFEDLAFHVMGEPALHPDIGLVVRHALERGATVNFVTNGSVLDESVLHTLVANGCWRIVVSVHTKDLETSRSRAEAGTRRFSRYERKVQSLVGRFLTLRAAAESSTMLELHYLDTSAYRPRLDVIGDRRTAQFVVDEWSQWLVGSGFEGRAAALPAPADSGGLGVLHQTDPAGGSVELARGLRVRFKRSYSFGNSVVDNLVRVTPVRAGTCKLPAEQIAILSNGDVVSCCVDHEGVNVLGNVNVHGNLRDIWTGPVATRFRSEFAAGRVPSARCAQCLGRRFRAARRASQEAEYA